MADEMLPVAGAASILLQELAVWQKLDDEVLLRTPARMAKAYAELCALEDPDKVLRPLFDERHDELVLVRAVPFAALCEHHLLPFAGEAHVGYIPNGRVAGLSKLARLVRACGGITIQERMTTRIADTLESVTEAQGVMVVLEAAHTCMTIRGVRTPGTKTTTSAVRGTFRQQAAARTEFMALIREGR